MSMLPLPLPVRARGSSASAWAARSSRRSRPTAASIAAGSSRTRGSCLGEGCSSVTLFGTTGEGASLGLGERAAMLDAMVAAGFDLRAARCWRASPPRRSRTPSAQANQLYDAGGRGMLLAPPFYFKGPGDEGLYRWFSTVLERCRVAARGDPLPPPVGDRRAAVVDADRPRSSAPFPAWSPASRTRAATGRRPQRCSPTTRTCTSWSATSACSRAPSATAAAARSTASRTSARALLRADGRATAPRCPGIAALVDLRAALSR